MNIKQTINTLESAGFTVELYPVPWRQYTAFKRDKNGEGVRVHLCFGEQKGRKGKPLEGAIVHAFPLFDRDRRLLNGAKQRDFQAGRNVSELLGAEVHANGCTNAMFNCGKYIGKF